MSSIDVDPTFPLVLQSDLVSALDEVNQLEKDLKQHERELDQRVREKRMHFGPRKQNIKELKENVKLQLRLLDVETNQMPIYLNEKAEQMKNDELGNEAETPTDSDVQERLHGNFFLIGKVKQELDNLHYERFLDLSRAKLLDFLGIRSWQLLKEKATESGMALHDYVVASLNDKDLKEEISLLAVEKLCNHSFIHTENIHDLMEAYVSVYGQGVVGQSA